MNPLDPKRPVVLIPCNGPGPRLPQLVASLLDAGTFAGVVVVDDGSGTRSGPLLAQIEALHGATLLRHHVHLGKGAALKTGLNWIGVHIPDSAGVVTLDANGLYSVTDAIRVAEALADAPASLVLGSRTLPAGAALGRRLGNAMTRWVLRAIAGVTVSDAQTGLRGIPMAFLPHLLRLRTTGHDFELDMLLAARHDGIALMEVPIETERNDADAGVRFNPVIDSLRIYYVFLRFNLSSFSSFLLDFGLFALLMLVGASIATAQFGARAVSSLFNFLVNRHFVFKSDQGRGVSLLLYYATVVLIAACSYGLILLLHQGLGLSVYSAKLVADTALYIASFAIQREFVFRRLADEQPLE